MQRVECVVIGGGLVGLACARSLAARGRGVVLCEATKTLASGVSSRSSEVIHAGLYYDATPVKRAMCVAGRELLYSHCETHGVRFRQCGKLVVATNKKQLGRLEEIRGAALRAGVEISMLTPDQVAEMEPEVSCVAALHSPRTGVVDSHGLALSLAALCEDHGGTLALSTRLLRGRGRGSSVALTVASGDEIMELECDFVVNAGGLSATRIAAAMTTGSERAYYSNLGRFAKGSYFKLQGKAPFSGLVYPLPEAHGLGVHATVDIEGASVKFGPDVEFLPDDVDVDAFLYDVDEAKRDAFAASIRSYYPRLDASRLEPDYAGVRPKLNGPADFMLDNNPHPRIFHLLGIESPGITASLALADHIADKIDSVAAASSSSLSR